MNSRKGWRHRPRLFVITACIALYSMSVWHWATTVYYSLVIVSTLTTAMSGGVDCVKRILLGSFCPVAFQNMVSGYYEGPGDTMEIAAPLHVCVTTTPLSISVSEGRRIPRSKRRSNIIITDYYRRYGGVVASFGAVAAKPSSTSRLSWTVVIDNR